MLGGGNFLVQNKVLPGTYINFVSVRRPSNIFGDRGYATFAMPLSWGDELITLSKEELQKDSLKLLGLSFDDELLRPVREVLLNAKTLYLYRLNGKGEKAKVTVNGLNITAKYAGLGGNKIEVAFKEDIDNKDNIVFEVYFYGRKVLSEKYKKTDKIMSNDYVDVSGEANYTELGGQVKALAGGTDKEVKADDYSEYLKTIESYYFNTIGYAGDDDSIKSLFVSFAKRMRDEVGKKCQVVLYNKAANYEGVINVTSKAKEDLAGFVYYVLGASAGCDVNKGLDNSLYLGEYTLIDKLAQRDLEKAIIKGEFVFHRDNDDVRVLEDINSFIEHTKDKNKDFAQNQVIRVLDQIAMDIAKIFNSMYIGKVQNNEDGRISLWADITNHAKTLEKLGAIEDFEPTDVVVKAGHDKDSVEVDYLVKPIMVMRKFYMIVRVK